MDFSGVCRMCLRKKSLNPIFSNCVDTLRYSFTILAVTGCKVTEDDGLPQYACTPCINFIKKAMKFRKICMDTEKHLIEQLHLTAKVETTEELPSKTYVSDIEVPSPSASVFVKSEEKLEEETETDIQEEIKPNTLKEDEDDKPLKYLIEYETESSNDNYIFINELVLADDVESDTKKEKKLKNETPSMIKQETEEPYEVDMLIEIKPEKEKKFKKGTQSMTKQETEVPYEVDVHSDAKITRVTCKICYKSLSIRSIDAHMASRHPGLDQRKVQCELCNRFVLKDKMRRHKKMMHGITVQETKCLKCSFCKSEFESKSALVEHVPNCTAKKKKRKISDSGRAMAVCDVCNKTMQKASLRMHKQIKHNGLGPVCEHCGKRFGSKFRLDEHYRAKHDYEKFTCQHCDFKSASVMAMRNHERRHRGEKPFSCDSCEAKFHAAYLLAQHRHSHRTERLVKCNLCSSTFKANNSLHMHKITCHSESLYACYMCNKTYSCRHYVVKHLRQFHQYRGDVGPLRRQDKPRRTAEE